jgi:hypothetical protein
MNAASNDIVHDYLHVLERAIIDLRARIRYNDDVSMDEVHDILDAVHNIPKMLRGYGGWFVTENIDADLGRYDTKWSDRGQATMRKRLMDHLQRARDGEYDEA